jgi:acetyl-CoA carboxylase biotin carboxyl carrier protein
MPEDKIAARVEEQGAEGFLVRSPAVGVIDAVPKLGIYLNAMESFLCLKVLGRRHPVLLPRGVQGRVVEQLVEGRCVAVQYNQPLVRLKAGADLSEEERKKASAEAAGPGLGDLIAVKAPTDGIFYRRATPDSPAYVEAGAAVARGTVLGLVEVMKSFNQIVYGGTGLPDRGTVAQILVEDAAEVKFGQPLFTIKPAS